MLKYPPIRWSSGVTLLGIVLFGAVLLGGCREDAVVPPPPPEPQVILPLAIGNRWTYREQTLTPSGAVFEEMTLRVSVSRDTLIDGERWWAGNFDGYSMIILQTNRSDGLWRRSLVSKSQPFVLYPYPAERGTRFRDGFAQVLATDTLITVPAGSFRCYQYRSFRRGGSNTNLDEVLGDSFWSPEVGEVKYIQFYGSNRGPVRDPLVIMELMNYTFNAQVY